MPCRHSNVCCVFFFLTFVHCGNSKALFSMKSEKHLGRWRPVTKRNDMKGILMSLLLFPMFRCTLTLPCSQLTINPSVRRPFKCLACLLVSITFCESRILKWKLSKMLYFWHIVHTHYPNTHADALFLCLAFLISSWLLILSWFINHTGLLLDAQMILSDHCACLVLQTPLHLAGPPAVPGIMPGM